MTKNINYNLNLPNNKPEIPDINIKNPNQELDEDQLLSIYFNWKSIRQLYPGWEIAPSQNRNNLWYSTREYYNRIFWDFKKLSNPNDINLLYELIWRVNICLLPLDTGYLNLIIEVVQKYNPFPDIIQNLETTITSENQEYKNYNWKEISTQWIELIFTIIADFRHDLNENLFYKWINILCPLSDINSEISIKIYYEKSLFLLNQLRESELRNTLSEWPENNDFPFYQAQKAAIYAELGDVDIARKTAESALNEIRNQLHMSGTSYKLMSQEGLVIALLNLIYDNSLNRSEVYYENKDRLEKLIFYRCNPYTDIDGLDSDLKGTQPVYKKSVVRRKTFDPDMINISKSTADNVIDSDKLMPAYNLLYLFEKGCIPMRCGIVTVYNEAIFNAAKWIKTTLPVWSLSSFLRSSKEENFDKYFSRIFIAILTEAEIDFIYENFYNSLNKCLESISLSIEKISFISDK